MKLKSTLLYITAATLTFSSCQIGKHYTRPELNLPEQLDSTQQDTLTIAEMQWWEIYYRYHTPKSDRQDTGAQQRHQDGCRPCQRTGCHETN